MNAQHSNRMSYLLFFSFIYIIIIIIIISI